jgi:hypothetical protein
VPFHAIPQASAPRTRFKEKQSREVGGKMDNLPKGITWNGQGWKGEYPVKDLLQCMALDEIDWTPFFVLGVEDKEPFYLEFRKIKRFKLHWSVSPVVEELSSIRRLPLKHDKEKVTVLGIFNGRGDRITKKATVPPSKLPPPLFSLLSDRVPTYNTRLPPPLTTTIIPLPPTLAPTITTTKKHEVFNGKSPLPKNSVPGANSKITLLSRPSNSIAPQIEDKVDVPKISVSNPEAVNISRWEDGDSECSDEDEVFIVEEDNRDKVGNPETQKSDFWWRQGVIPTLPEELAGSWRKRLQRSKLREEESLMDFVRLGLAVDTRKLHRRLLNWLCGEPEPGPRKSIVAWILERIGAQSKLKKWQGSTLSTKLASCQGALAHLPIYRVGIPPVVLKNSSEWRMGLKGAGNMMRRAMPKQAAILTEATLEKALKLEPIKKVRVALEVAWLTAGRGGDVVKLRTTDVWTDEKGTWVRFVVGKTATSQPYTVNTARMSPEATEYLEERRKEANATQWLFPQVLGPQLKDAMRRVDPLLEQRSIRRGALQLLASRGMTDE